MNHQVIADNLAQAARLGLERHVFPGCVLGYVSGDYEWVRAFGHLTDSSDSPSVTPEVLYDVASVTKSVPTSTLVLQALEQGRLHVDDLVSQHLPELENNYRDGLTIKHLLTYSAIWDVPGGLTRLALKSKTDLIPTLLRTPLSAAPGKRYFYTNAPAVLLGLILTAIYQEPLDSLADRHIFRPLNMQSSTFHPDVHQHLVAPSELSQSRGLIQGVPNDETAWVLSRQGQVAGNAGLFTTVPDLLRFARMILNGGRANGVTILHADTIERMRQNQLAGIGEFCGLGWEVHRPEVMGSATREGIVMKSGFTGCLIVIDRDRQRALVHLSNRTYPHRPGREPIRAFWRSINQIAFGA